MTPTDRRFLGLVTLVFTLGLVLATFVNPLFFVPDEPFHADMIELADDVRGLARDGWPLVGERNLQAEIVEASRLHEIEAKRNPATALPRDQRVPLEVLAESGAVGRDNRMTQHPPLYYVLLAVGIEGLDVVDPGAFAYDLELWLTRLLNILMLVPLPLLAWLTARELSNQGVVHRAAAVIPLGIPGLMLRNGPILNNDNLLTVFGASMVYFAVRIAREDLRMRVALLAGASCGLAMISKALGLFLLGALGLTYAWVLLGRVRRRQELRPVVLSGATAVATAMLTGGWWYVRNLVVAGTIRQIGYTRPSVEGFVPDWPYWLGQVLQRSWNSFWGGYWTLNYREHPTLLSMLLLLTVIGVAVALLTSRRADRRSLVVALLPVIVTAVAMYVNQANNYVDRGRIGGVQGRYFYGGLTGLSSTMMVGFAALFGRFRSWLPFTVVVGSGIMYTIGFHAMLVSEWARPGASLGWRVRSVLAWAAPPSWFVVAVGLLFATSGLLLAWVVRPGAIAGATPRLVETPGESVEEAPEHY